jgi:hypothetical protein
MDYDKREITLLKYKIPDLLSEIGGLYIVLKLVLGFLPMFFAHN